MRTGRTIDYIAERASLDPFFREKGFGKTVRIESSDSKFIFLQKQLIEYCSRIDNATTTILSHYLKITTNSVRYIIWKTDRDLLSKHYQHFGEGLLTREKVINYVIYLASKGRTTAMRPIMRKFNLAMSSVQNHIKVGRELGIITDEIYSRVFTYTKPPQLL